MIRLSILVSFLFLAGQPSVTSATELRCEDGTIVVQGAELEDLQDGCEAAKSAAQFFESSGMPMPRNVKITIADAQPATFLGTGEMGNYDARQEAIRVLGYQSATKATDANDPGLGRIVTRVHWRSYIVHELAHAAIHAGCDNACPSRAIHEYVAAVAQIASLPGNERSVLLAPYGDLEPFRQPSEITETYYAINPHYFAAKSYKHYQQLSDPRSFFHGLLHLSE